MCWTFCWTKCWTLFLAKIRILSAISIISGDRLGKSLGDGAGEGNRTLVFSLEGCCSTIELHPRASDHLTRRADGLNRACGLRACSARLSRPKPLTPADSPPILRSPPKTKGGDPVSYLKRCHLAGIAR